MLRKLSLFFTVIASVLAQPYAVTGTIKYPDGTNFNGYVLINLPRPAINTSGSGSVNAPQRYRVNVTNGSFTGSLYSTQSTTTPTHTGPGLNDLGVVVSGPISLLAQTVCVKIDSTGTTDTFSWGVVTTGAPVDCSNSGSAVQLSATASGYPTQVLGKPSNTFNTQTNPGYGIALAWGAKTGHTAGDTWTFQIKQSLSPAQFYQTAFYNSANQLVSQSTWSVNAAAMNVAFTNVTLYGGVFR